MIALLCFFLTLLASPFKSKSRLEAENAGGRIRGNFFQPSRARWKWGPAGGKFFLKRDSGLWKCERHPVQKALPSGSRMQIGVPDSATIDLRARLLFVDRKWEPVHAP
jgi:hypothetical protein